MGTHEQTGIAGCFSVDEYEQDVDQEARAHAARQGRRSHAAHRRAARADWRRVPDLSSASADVDARRAARDEPVQPLYDFTAADGVQHTVWRAAPTRTRRRSSAGIRADSRAVHRRRPSPRGERGARACASCGRRSAATRATRRRSSRSPFPTTRCRSCPYQPHGQGSRGPDAGAVSRRRCASVSRSRTVRPTPARKGDVSMYLDGRWYAIDLPAPRREDDSRASSLDVALLQRHVLEQTARHWRRPHRQAHRLRRRRARHGALEQAVDSGKAAVAFSMYPVDGRRSDGDLRRRRHHAAEVHLVRAQAAGRAADSCMILRDA